MHMSIHAFIYMFCMCVWGVWVWGVCMGVHKCANTYPHIFTYIYALYAYTFIYKT